MNDKPYPRDMVGYGGNYPHPRWPDGARLALNFVINIEEGSEPSMHDGENITEANLAEVPPRFGPGIRDFCAESTYEYGTRAGFWRVMRLFQERGMLGTFYGCGLAMERNPPMAEAIRNSGWDVASHGWRWIMPHSLTEEQEREHIRKAVESIQRLSGERPYGWYWRYAPTERSRRLLVEEGGFLYDSDAYNDDLPYWVKVEGKDHLIIPYQMDTNDMRFGPPYAFSTATDYFTYLKDSFDMLYAEGASLPKMMSCGLHLRLVGRPGRAAGLARFLDYVKGHSDVWVCRRVDIARHWIKHHPPR
ncbi:MAG: polysaccharide deacetylase family protein [Alphaproteobacteria bacterium]|nr:polysaccharide deacetylase family protein [Alphaproteobacteria bacterium]